MELKDIESLISIKEEKPWLEYKGSLNWSDSRHKAKIVKAILSLSNIEGGGYIVIGMRENNGKWEPAGMEQSDYDSFILDPLRDHLSNYADPYVKFEMKKKIYDGKKFIIIYVNEFDEIPVICKKQYEQENLYKGRIYVRTSTAKIQSRQVENQTEMREILDLAIDKGIKKYIKKAKENGLFVSPTMTPEEGDEKKFKDQIRMLKK